MKLLIFLVLAVIGAQAAVVESPARSNLGVGVIGNGASLLHTSMQTRNAVNGVQTHSFTYRTNGGRRITALRAEEVGGTQRGTATIISGGIGQASVTVRFQSIRGRGYNYRLRVWGR